MFNNIPKVKPMMVFRPESLPTYSSTFNNSNEHPTIDQMPTLLNDNVLETLKCSDCKKYLSVLPIKVYPNRKILCGRCCKSDDNGLSSLYEQLVEKLYFKCTNRYEGCNFYGRPYQMVTHEITCKGGTYDCVICKEFSATSYDMVQHLITVHHKAPGELIFFIDLEEEVETYTLVLKENLVFLVYILLDKILGKLRLCCINIGPKGRAEKVKNQFSLFKNDQLIYSTEMKKCLSAVHADSVFEIPLDALQQEAGVNIINCRLNIDASLVDNCLVVDNSEKLQFKFGSFDNK